MSTIVTRAGKGSPLTNAELDSNFINLNTDKLEVATAASTYAPLGGSGATGTWNISILGNAATVTNGVYTSGSYANPAWITSLSETKVLPSQTGNNGKFLTTNGTSTSWGTVDLTPYLTTATAASTYVALGGSYANPSWITSLSETKVLPSQTSQSGKYLTTNGTSTSWATIEALPSQTGNSGKFLTTNGSVASWGTVDLTPYLTSATAASTYVALTGNQTIGGTKTFSNSVVIDNVAITIGQVTTGGGGNVRLKKDDGTVQWVAGILGSAGATSYEWYNNVAAATRLTLDTAGNLTAAANITAYSDERLKENIQLIPDALAKVESVRGVTFTRKEDGSAGMGVIAQEIRKIAPEVIVIDKDGMMSVAYGNLVGLLIEAVKDLSGQVKELKAKVGI